MKALHWCNRGKSSKGQFQLPSKQEPVPSVEIAQQARGCWWRVYCWWSCGERSFQFRKPDSWLPERALCVATNPYSDPVQGSGGKRRGAWVERPKWYPPKNGFPTKDEAPRHGVSVKSHQSTRGALTQRLVRCPFTASKPRCFSAPWSISKGAFMHEGVREQTGLSKWDDPGHQAA